MDLKLSNKIKNANINFYNTTADGYEQKHIKQFSETNIKRIKKNLKIIHGKVLDIGSGTGFLSEILNKKSNVSQIVALDSSKEVLKIQNKKKLKKVKTIVGDAENLPFKENSFDCCVSNSVLHHIPNPQKLISESYRVLKEGGIFQNTLEIF